MAILCRVLAASHGYRAVFWVTSGITGVSVLLFGLVTRALVAKGQLQRG